MGSLDTYNEKRNFDDTPEPRGEEANIGAERNRFVIQHHLATRDHYDFRIQVEDVLVSWAIPKEPVMDPSVKRLAIKVEDHPLSYIHFEGNIPRGNYGAGTVMVWEVGFYYLEDGSFPAPETIEKMLRKGHLAINLNGSKLRGLFHLVKIKKSDKNEWLFMKAEEPAKQVSYYERSALTGRTMEEIKANGALLKSNNGKNTLQPETAPESFARSSSFPGFIHPMLATAVKEPFDKDNWIYEHKLDGYRIVATRFGDEVNLYSRNGNLYNEKYPAIAKALNNFRADFVIDGEVCYMDNNDRPDFQKLQHDYDNQKALHYYVFDLLWLNNYSLNEVPLILRKSLLKELLKAPPENIHYLTHVETQGIALFEEVKKKQLEGIIAKRKQSIYYPGTRSKDWLKIKTSLRQEMLICGYLPSDKAGMLFSSLLCAQYDEGVLMYTGKVGTGFSDELQRKLMKLMQPLEVKHAPVVNPPRDKNIHWIEPVLVAEVHFTEWTKSGVMRHPAFIGLRQDKPAPTITREQPQPVSTMPTKATLTHPDKLFFPKEKITKRDVFDYYQTIAPLILPYLENRPQSLFRTPDGVNDKGFFQKDMKDMAPEWAETLEIENSDGETTNYLLCQNIDTLLWMVNLGCIEINPWNSSIPHLDNPDYLVIDLDPVDVDFKKLVDVALEFRKTFDDLSMSSFVKTSGGRGLHIYVPVKPEYNYDQIQQVVKNIEQHVHQKQKKITSFERSPSKRKGKIYLDYLQNGKGKTMASVYSLRPREGAGISTPLYWDEVNHDLDPKQFNFRTIRDRLKEKGDLWSKFFDSRADLKALIQSSSSKT